MRGCWILWQHWATTGNCWQLSNTKDKMLETLATLGYNWQLMATQQRLWEDAGYSGNTGLQQATAGNSATPRIRCWRLWQHWATTGNWWQLSNAYERMLDLRLTERSHSALVTERVDAMKKICFMLGKKITINTMQCLLWSIYATSFIMFTFPFDSPTLKLSIDAR